MSEAQVKDKVQRILTEEFGSVSIDRDGDFFVRFGSTKVFIAVKGVNETTTFVNSFAFILEDVPLTPEVYRWAATDGQDYRFGHAKVIERDNGLGRIVFQHVLLGDFLDAEELKWAVIALGQAADELDDELKARFGGNRFIED